MATPFKSVFVAIATWQCGLGRRALPVVGDLEADTTLHSEQQVGLLTKRLYPEGLEGGKCMTGTRAGYYYGGPSSGQSTTWVIYLKGGGGCSSAAACKKWAEKSGTMPSNDTKEGEFALSSSPTDNPHFHDAHHVYVSYCTGDFHSGQLAEPAENNASWGFVFDGHLNFQLLVEDLMNTTDLSSAQDVLLYGNSAGGLGVLINCDYLQTKLTFLGVDAKVKCNVESGFYMPGYAEDNEDASALPTLFEYWTVNQTNPPREDGHVPPDAVMNKYQPEPCVNAEGEGANCLNAVTLYPHMQAPLFIMEAEFDGSKLYQLGLPDFNQKKESDPFPFTQASLDFMAYYGRAMRASTGGQLKTGDALFMPSCFAHGITHSSIQNITALQALSSWFWELGETPLRLEDEINDFGVPVNPSCFPEPPKNQPNLTMEFGPGACADKWLGGLCPISSHPSPGKCNQCARQHKQRLNALGCTTPEIKSHCEGAR